MKLRSAVPVMVVGTGYVPAYLEVAALDGGIRIQNLTPTEDQYIS